MAKFYKLRMKRKLKRARVCCYCGCQLNDKNKTIDHVKPLGDGGNDLPDNLVVCCRECNHAKDDMSLVEFQRIKFEKVWL